MRYAYYRFKSKSNPTGPEHVVEVAPDGTMHCNCPAGSRGVRCWHLGAAAELRGAERQIASHWEAAGIREATDAGDAAMAIALARKLFPSASAQELADAVDEICKQYDEKKEKD